MLFGSSTGKSGAAYERSDGISLGLSSGIAWERSACRRRILSPRRRMRCHVASTALTTVNRAIPPRYSSDATQSYSAKCSPTETLAVTVSGALSDGESGRRFFHLTMKAAEKGSRASRHTGTIGRSHKRTALEKAASTRQTARDRKKTSCGRYPSHDGWMRSRCCRRG